MAFSREVPRYKNCGYWRVKKWLIERGFYIVQNSGKIDKANMIGSITFSCGASEIELIVHMLRHQRTGRLECGKVLRATETILD